MLFLIGLLRLPVPAWVIAVVVVLFTGVIGVNALSHSIELKTALKTQSERLLQEAEMARIEAELEAERVLDEFRSKRIAENKITVQDFTRSLDSFERQKESDIATIEETYEDEIDDILSSENACLVTPAIRERLRKSGNR